MRKNILRRKFTLRFSRPWFRTVISYRDVGETRRGVNRGAQYGIKSRCFFFFVFENYKIYEFCGPIGRLNFRKRYWDYRYLIPYRTVRYYSKQKNFLVEENFGFKFDTVLNYGLKVRYESTVAEQNFPFREENFRIPRLNTVVDYGMKVR